MLDSEFRVPLHGAKGKISLWAQVKSYYRYECSFSLNFESVLKRRARNL